MQIEVEREEDGRWLTEIPELPGVMADRLEHGEVIPELVDVFSVAA
jgi:predicted RNase H-like HicB family nuclease